MHTAQRDTFINNYQAWVAQDETIMEAHRTNIQFVRNTRRLNDYKLKRAAHLEHLAHALVLKTIRDTMAIPSSILINRADTLRDDLDMDDYDIWDIALTLEVELTLSFTDTQPNNWRTVQDILDAIALTRAIQHPPLLLARQAS